MKGFLHNRVSLAIAAALTLSIGLWIWMPEENRIDRDILSSFEKKKKKPYDQPAEAVAFFLEKRLSDGMSDLPIERYEAAREELVGRELFSTSLNRYLEPGEGRALGDLGSWEELGPGNVGGRTRALVIDPNTPSTMYAGGVAGGVWKTTNSGASWTPLDDLMDNLAVTALAMDPDNSNILYAGTGEGFFNADAVRGAGIFKSTNAGLTWTHLSDTSGSNFHYVNDIIISPNDSNTVYAATRRGIFRTVNGGTDWLRVFSGLASGCQDLEIRQDSLDDVVFATCGQDFSADNAGVAGNDGTIYRNTDAGGSGTWDAVFTEAGMDRTSIAIAPSNEDVIYAISASSLAGDYNQGLHAIFRSIDGGDNWTAQVRNSAAAENTLLLTNPAVQVCTNRFLNQGWYDQIIAVDPADPDVVWVGGIDLFRSDDGGQSWGHASIWWAASTNPRYVHADQHNILFHPDYNGTTNQTMFVANDGGVYRTDNALDTVVPAILANACNSNNGIAVSWQGLNNTYGVTQFYHGSAYPDGTGYLAGAQDNGTNFGNDTDGSESWIEVLGGDGGYTAIDPRNTDVIYAETTGISIQKSTNGGLTFSSAISGISDSGASFINPFTMDMNNPDILWTGGWYAWRTDNGASSWVRASTLLPGNGSLSAVEVFPTDSDRVLIGMTDGFIAYTTSATTNDSTTDWSVGDLFPGVSTGRVSGVAFDPSNSSIAYATVSTFGRDHVWRSTDGGATWNSIENNLPDIPAHCIVVHPDDPARLYLGTDLGVFVSTNTGGSWSQENTGFANVVVESMTIVGDTDLTLFAFTHGRGTWRVPLEGAIACNYELGATSADFDDQSNTGDVSVTAGDTCDWTAVSNNGWITVTAGSSGTGNGTVSYSITSNPGPGSREGTITIAGDTFTINQAAPCSYDISPTTADFNDQSNTGDVSVTAGGACDWTAVSNNGWITVTAGSSGTGNGTVSYSITSNPGPGSREGTITIAGETFTITQAAPCINDISPTIAEFSAESNTGDVSVTAGETCDWTAVSNDGWITVTAGSSGTGNGTVSYSITSNPGPGSREGTITIAGETFTITQAACAYELSSPSQDFSAVGGQGSFTVTTTASCDWTPATTDDWITINSGSGPGSGLVSYTVAPSGVERTGTITVAGLVFTVEQRSCVQSQAFYDALPNWLNGEDVLTLLQKAGCQ